MAIEISAAFDGGNIEVLDAEDASAIRLAIRPDPGTGVYHWFSFKVSGAAGRTCRMHIVNAGGAFARWDGYRAVVSEDNRTWRRADTHYEDGVLTITHAPQALSFHVAAFAPHGSDRHAALIARATASGLARAESIGLTIDGQSLDLLQIGSAEEHRALIWVTARQHPGETMGGWWMEGFLSRLLDCHSDDAGRLRERACIFIVPNMNPDGCRRGHLRTNAVGVDLNRVWHAPDPKRSPEVYFVRERMSATQPDVVLDVHGIEDMEYAFIVGPEGPAGRTAPVVHLVQDFKRTLAALNPDLSPDVGFDTAPDDIHAGVATNYQGVTFGSVCMTLEMPFGDTRHSPDMEFGFSPARAMRLGRDCVAAMAALLPRLLQERYAWR